MDDREPLQNPAHGPVIGDPAVENGSRAAAATHGADFEGFDQRCTSRHFSLISATASRKRRCSAVWSHSNTTISVVTISAP